MVRSTVPLSVSALKLPPKERMGLAALLLESLEETPQVDEKLLRLLTKRSEELRSGKVKGLTTEQAYGFAL